MPRGVRAQRAHDVELMVRIEHRDRLVDEQHGRFDGQRAREQHARALADREPVHAARRRSRAYRFAASPP